MARFLHHDFQRIRRRTNWLSLAFFFVLGLFSGGYLFLRADDSFAFLMCRALSGRVSIVGLASVSVLPFLFSAFAVSLYLPRLFRVVAYCKALTFSYVALGIWAAYGSGAWLAHLLLMFSDICTIPLLWLYWLRHSEAPGRDGDGCYLITLIFIGSLDYFIVSPFAAAL